MDAFAAGDVLPAAPRWPEQGRPLAPYPAMRPPLHVHVIWSLSLGGAERIVADLANAYCISRTPCHIIVLKDAPVEHRISTTPRLGVTLHRLGDLPWAARYAYAAGVIQTSGLPAYCHLMGVDVLEMLWRFGCSTVPVIHNAVEGWKTSADALNRPMVPFVVACGETVSESLRGNGLERPIRVLRHVVSKPVPMSDFKREEVRAAFGADGNTLLIGMVGRFVPQKDFIKAVRILAELRRREAPARLVIIGGAADEAGVEYRRAVAREAAALGVRDALVMPGPILMAANLLPAFDVFLNTSRFEGVSVATMEAVTAGVPVVSGHVGGQREAVGPADRLLSRDDPTQLWAEAVQEQARRGRVAPPAHDRRAVDAAAHVWPWLLALGPDAPEAGRNIIFVTGNLDVGGAQRSLCNLAAELGKTVAVTVAVCGPCGVPGFMDEARNQGVAFLDLAERVAPTGGLHGRAGRILSLVLDRQPQAVVFWNMDAATKLVVAKVLEGGPIRVCDVSPGPMLYAELDAEAALGEALAFGPDRYLAAIDLLVAKYRGGGPDPQRGQPKSLAVIPNGVPEPGPLLPPGDGPAPPPGADPALAVVTVGRLTPAKRPELLPHVARALGRLLPGATLTVVGGTHSGTQDAGWRAMLAACGGALPDNLHFAGPDHRSTGFLPRFAAFYMVSTDQGCPNASLEAMVSGLPVVANPDGGTAEQVEDGVTGRLVSDQDDPLQHAEALAEALVEVLTSPQRAEMAAAARRKARQEFSMAAMADAYSRVLLTR